MTQRVVNYTYGTGNPVLPDGSIDVRDGIDNLQSFDIFMNADEDTYNQRDGDIVKTRAGAVRAVGIQRIGDFTTGCTVTERNQGVLYETEGTVYVWLGALPKVVPASSSPGSTGGISPSGDWVDIGDASAFDRILSLLSEPDGSSFVGFQQAGSGSVARASQDKMRESFSIKDFGAVGDGVADDTAAFAAAAARCLASSGNFDTICLEFPAGVYKYTISPNWAMSRLELRCEPGVVFNHVGAGAALIFDGGAGVGGIFVSKLTGSPLIKGNAASTDGLYVRNVHNSKFDVRVRDVSAAAVHIDFSVCSEFTVRSSPVGEPAFAIAPAQGILIDGTLGATSACTFYNPIMEGSTGYGLNLQNCIMSTFIGGTSESNAGGVFIENNCFGNTFINTDFEFNTAADVFCKGVENKFIGILADKSVQFTSSSASNIMIGGRINELKVAGDRNSITGVTYAIAGGLFTDSGIGTVTRSVKSAVGGAALPDRGGNVVQTGSMGATDADALLYGASSLISGGPASEVDLFKKGTGVARLRASGGANPLSWGASGLGFFGATPINKPTVTGAKGGNAALTSLLSQLAAIGLITDSTT